MKVAVPTWAGLQKAHTFLILLPLGLRKNKSCLGLLAIALRCRMGLQAGH